MADDKANIRKEVRLTGAMTLEFMRISRETGLSECDILRLGLIMLRKNFIKSGMIDDTGELPE